MTTRGLHSLEQIEKPSCCTRQHGALTAWSRLGNHPAVHDNTGPSQPGADWETILLYMTTRGLCSLEQIGKPSCCTRQHRPSQPGADWETILLYTTAQGPHSLEQIEKPPCCTRQHRAFTAWSILGNHPAVHGSTGPSQPGADWETILLYTTAQGPHSLEQIGKTSCCTRQHGAFTAWSRLRNHPAVHDSTGPSQPGTDWETILLYMTTRGLCSLEQIGKPSCCTRQHRPSQPGTDWETILLYTTTRAFTAWNRLGNHPAVHDSTWPSQPGADWETVQKHNS